MATQLFSSLLFLLHIAARVAPSATDPNPATMRSLSALSALFAATLSLELVGACGGHDAHARRGATHVRRDAAPSGSGKYDIPPLSVITSGMPAGATPTLSATYSAGAKPTYSNAPALPAKRTCYLTFRVYSAVDLTICFTVVFGVGDWPELDQIPPTGTLSVSPRGGGSHDFDFLTTPDRLRPGEGVVEGTRWTRHPRHQAFERWLVLR